MSPAAVLVLTGNQCLSCRNVGFLARRLEQAYSTSSGAFQLATSDQDVETVCSFLRTERLDVPVFTVPDSPFRALAADDSLSVVLLGTDAGSDRLLRADDGLDLLSRVQTELDQNQSPQHSTTRERGTG